MSPGSVGSSALDLVQALSPLVFFMRKVWEGLWGLWCLLEPALSLPTTGRVSAGSPQILRAAGRVTHLAVCLVETPISTRNRKYFFKYFKNKYF